MSNPAPESAIPSLCLDRFNEAVRLANAGDAAAALAHYRAIFAGEDGQRLQGTIPGRFVALVKLRQAYCLMDLGDYDPARELLAQLDQGLAGQLSTEEIFDFYLAYGNVLGNLALVSAENQATFLPEAIDRFAHAMNVAVEYLQDPDRFRTAWYWVLYWEKQTESWEALDEHCLDAGGFGAENNDPQLQLIALEFRCYAHRALGRPNEARQSATAILAWKQQTQASPEDIDAWNDFLDSLD